MFGKGLPVCKAMGSLQLLFFSLFSLSLASSLHAQREQREPLTAEQQNQIAEAGIDPDQRIGLYTKYINEHAQTLSAVGRRSESGRGKRLEAELQDFSSLIDELASNLDEYGDRKADIRKALKGVNEAVSHWQEILRGLPKETASGVALSDATEALRDLADQTKRLTAEQETYFKEHKDAKGQQREEPQ